MGTALNLEGRARGRGMRSVRGRRGVAVRAGQPHDLDAARPDADPDDIAGREPESGRYAGDDGGAAVVRRVRDELDLVEAGVEGDAADGGRHAGVVGRADQDVERPDGERDGAAAAG